MNQYFKYDDVSRLRSVDVCVSTLDDELHGLTGSDRGFFLKVDTQGTELQVLKGCSKSLRYCSGILVEYMFLTPYQGQSSFYDMLSFLQGFGFRCCGVLDFTRNDAHRITGVDFLFLPEERATKG